MRSSLASVRREYSLAGLRRSDLSPDPIRQFESWFDDAVRAQVLEPSSMSLATVSAQGQPSTRIVMLKGLDARGFVFFTNYASRKGRELAENSRAALLVYWREMERQVTICGAASKVPRDESEAYFQKRCEASQWTAWASPQSQPVGGREELEKEMASVKKKFAAGTVPCPPGWGGYVVVPSSIEFWQGRTDRLHDRFCYTRTSAGAWKIERLAP
jgi:pyridoxamine 5'-phosphate oxidase